MKHFKHIVTSGCSFSDAITRYTWPIHLEASYDVNCVHMGLSSQGNSLIARKAIFAVQQLLDQGAKPDEILVGIMWSGPDRHDTYISNIKGQLSDDIKNLDNMNTNPTTYVDDDPGGWLIMNPHWKEKTSKIYYSHLHDYANHRVNTYEKILWVQSYLKLLGIRYFMSPFTSEVFKDSNFHNNPNVKWMRDLIDWAQWLPVGSMHEWCYTHWTDDDFPQLDVKIKETEETIKWPDNHPTRIMHERFTKEIILPHIKNRFVDYYCPEFKEGV